MKRSILLALALIALPISAAHADAAPNKSDEARIPRQLNSSEAARFRAIFSAIDRQQWADAAARIDAEPASPIANFARAELYLAKGSPRVELPQLMALLTAAPTLPQAPQLANLAKLRGAAELPVLPQPQRLIWTDGAPVRSRAGSTKADAAAADLARQMVPFVKEDRAEEAEALLGANAHALTPEARTEWQAARRLDLLSGRRRQERPPHGCTGAARAGRMGGAGRLDFGARRVADERLRRRRTGLPDRRAACVRCGAARGRALLGVARVDALRPRRSGAGPVARCGDL